MIEVAIYDKRVKSGIIVQVERARRAIRVFFLIRELYLTLNMEVETQLPLTNPANCVQVNNVLDLSKSYFPQTVFLKQLTIQKNKASIFQYLICNMFFIYH